MHKDPSVQPAAASLASLKDMMLQGSSQHGDDQKYAKLKKYMAVRLVAQIQLITEQADKQQIKEASKLFDHDSTQQLIIELQG